MAQGISGPGSSVNETVVAVYNAAVAARAAGLCVVPPAEDGSKRPLPNSRGYWDPFKRERPAPELFAEWYPGRTGLGVINGAVSGNAEFWDFDDRPTYEAFVHAARASGLGPIIDRIEAGYCDDTAGNGVRWAVRTPDEAQREPGAGVKLAKRPKEEHEKKHAKDKWKALIELPGYSILAPSNGKVHPSGRPYVRRSGDFSTIASYTMEEREALLDLARTFDQSERVRAAAGQAQGRGDSGGVRPGEDYNAKTTWEDLLVGWRAVFTRGGVTYWCRPGKNFGISATTNYKGSDLLYVFSTSTEFDADKSYDRFAAYAVLHHRGDFSAAAKALAKEGYGKQREDAEEADADNRGPEKVEYRQSGQGIEWLKERGKDKRADRWIPLTNFSATIESEVTLDDDVETRKEFELSARLRGREYAFTVPASQFASLNWAIEKLGARAIVEPGQATARRVAVAIQTLSGEVPERRVFTHTGWRLIDRSWLYMHAGGALGTAGPVDGIEVQLPEELQRFDLTAGAPGDLCDAIDASMALCNVAPLKVTIPLLAGVYRAAVGDVDFALHISGQTGAKKTELGALAQQHVGPGNLARVPPASWMSTGNSLEVTAFAAKDAPLLVDDFVPQGSQVDRARQNAQADRLFRALGNKTGRGRLTPDGRQRRVRPPRSLIISTGEEIPAGHSLRARLVIVQVQPGDVDDEKLTMAQRDAASGAYANAMAGFIRWLASRLNEVRADLKRMTSERRIKLPRRVHARTADNIAQLSAAWTIWLRFVAETGAMTLEEISQVEATVWQALVDLAVEQSAVQRVFDPVDRYFALVSSVLSSGRGHIASAAQPDRAPEGSDVARAMGWRRLADGVWQAQGTCIGWWAADGIYLEPEVSYSLAQQMGAASGEGVSVQPSTLHRRMLERKLLLSTEKRGGEVRLRVRKGIGGQRKHVLHVAHTHLLSPNTGPTGPSGPEDENDEE
jgi:hypothetical protein